jgi:hypothetical protein
VQHEVGAVEAAVDEVEGGVEERQVDRATGFETRELAKHAREMLLRGVPTHPAEIGAAPLLEVAGALPGIGGKEVGLGSGRVPRRRGPRGLQRVLDWAALDLALHSAILPHRRPQGQIRRLERRSPAMRRLGRGDAQGGRSRGQQQVTDIGPSSATSTGRASSIWRRATGTPTSGPTSTRSPSRLSGRRSPSAGSP